MEYTTKRMDEIKPYDFKNQSVQYVVGMSVPPVMMAKIAEQIYKQWLTKTA